VTPKAGGKVDLNRVTQFGQALQELGIKMIPAYSPEARGRMERSYRTWQGRLPQELRIRNIRTVEEANRFLREEYQAEFNRRFTVPAAAKGSAFVPTRRKDLEWVFSIQHERTVNGDNTIALDNRVLPDRTDALAQHTGRLQGDGVRASQRHDPGAVRAARGGAFCARPDAGAHAQGLETALLTAAARAQANRGGMKQGRRAFLNLEAPPPDLRDLTLFLARMALSNRRRRHASNGR
jgi:hypothetical protein